MQAQVKASQSRQGQAGDHYGREDAKEKAAAADGDMQQPAGAGRRRPAGGSQRDRAGVYRAGPEPGCGDSPSDRDGAPRSSCRASSSLAVSLR